MYHILLIEELKEFIKVKCLGIKSFDDDYIFLDEFYSDSVSWDRKLVLLNYFLSRTIEQLHKENTNNQKVLDFIYSLQDHCYSYIQEGNLRFLKSLFSNDLGNTLTLEEQLIIAQHRIEK